MIDSPLADLEEWHVTVTVTRPLPLDRQGNRPPGRTEHTVPGCLIAPRSTENPVDRSELISNSAVLFAPVDADIVRGDQLAVDGHPLNGGRWRVDGAPQPWPFGVEITIVRED